MATTSNIPQSHNECNPLQDPRRQEFLALLPIHARNVASQTFLRATRAAAAMGTYAPGILSNILTDTNTRIAEAKRRRDDLVAARFALIRDAIQHHRPEALAFVAWCLEWDKLTPTKKSAARAEAHFAHEPATERQISYLRSLGWTGQPGLSKSAASRLIDTYKATKEAARRVQR